MTQYPPGTQLIRMLMDDAASMQNSDVITVISVDECEAEEMPHCQTVCPQCYESWDIDYDFVLVPENPREAFNQLIQSAVLRHDIEAARSLATHLNFLDHDIDQYDPENPDHTPDQD